MDATRTYLEDLTIGETWVSGSRTVTEADIIAFASLSGDHNPLHMDEAFAKETMFGQRIAHGLLGLAITSGLPENRPPLAVIAFMGVDWKFRKPIFIGDTVSCHSRISNVRGGKGSSRGIVVIERKLKNQSDEVTQSGLFTLMVAGRAKE